MKQHEDVKEKVARQTSIITEYQQQQEDDKFDSKGVEEEEDEK